MTSESYKIVVRQYGLLTPRDWGPDCEAELIRMTELWNRLVAIEAEHKAARRRIIETADTKAAQDDIDALMARRATLRAERSERRRLAHSRQDVPELDAEIAALGRALKDAVDTARQRRREAAAAARTALDAIEERRKAAVKTARQESGLYWGNYNAVVLSYERARQAEIKRGGTLRLRRRRGVNPVVTNDDRPVPVRAERVVNQIQGGMTAAALMSGEHSQVRIEPAADGALPSLVATIYTGRDQDGSHRRRTVTWPIVIDAERPGRTPKPGWPWPQDERLQEVVVTRSTRGGGLWKWDAVFMFRVPRLVEPMADGTACGIDIGWRKLNSGLRVAVLADAEGGTQEIILPHKMIMRAEYFYDLISRRSHARHEIVLRLQHVAWEKAPDDLRSCAAALDKRDEKGECSIRYGELRTLAAQWQQHHRYLPDVFEDVAEWAKEDRWMALQIVNGRRKLAGWRREVYRIEAKRVAQRYGVIGIEAIDLHAMASRAVGLLPDLARRLRFVAGLSDFTAALANAAAREGARIHRHAGKSSFVCHSCGHETAVNDRAELWFTCGGCGRSWDQDINAARVLLAAARASAPVAEEPRAPLAWEKRLAGKQKSRQGKYAG